jgi:hypothetical protein
MRNRIEGYFDKDANKPGKGLMDIERVRADAKTVIDNADSFVVMAILKHNPKDPLMAHRGAAISYIAGMMNTIGILVIVNQFMSHLMQRFAGGEQ